MSTLSVCIVAHDEAEHLRACLESVKWADEIVVAAAGGDAAVTALAEAFTDQVFAVTNRLNPNENKNRAFDRAGSTWILSLDPDERVGAALANAIRDVLRRDDPAVAGYTMPRLNRWFGRPLRHGGFYPDRQLRLFRRGRGRFDARHIHERLRVEGVVRALAPPLDHETYRSIAHYFEKLDFKAEFEAREMLRRGVRPGAASALGRVVLVPMRRFFDRFFLKQGFRDGWAGFLACALDGVNHLVRYQKMVEIDDSGGGRAWGEPGGKGPDGKTGHATEGEDG